MLSEAFVLCNVCNTLNVLHYIALYYITSHYITCSLAVVWYAKWGRLPGAPASNCLKSHHPTPAHSNTWDRFVFVFESVFVFVFMFLFDFVFSLFKSLFPVYFALVSYLREAIHWPVFVFLHICCLASAPCCWFTSIVLSMASTNSQIKLIKRFLFGRGPIIVYPCRWLLIHY